MEGSTSTCKDGQIMVLEHEHPLELVDLQRKRQHNEETDDDDGVDLDTIPEFRGQCGRCSQVISEYHMYYYKCVDTCDYSLHKFCAELPPKLEHTAHGHPLVISQYKHVTWKYCEEWKKPSSIILAIHTNCLLSPNLFCVYVMLAGLNIREFSIDVPSVVSLYIIKGLDISQNAEFVVLVFGIKKFFGFINARNVGTMPISTVQHQEQSLSCLSYLLLTVRHRYDKKHAFNLSYFPVENHPAEYFCDICESNLDPTSFFYHCNDSDQSMHLACAPMMFHSETPFRNDFLKADINKYINIKFRGTHSIKDHPHPLSFVQGLASDGNCESRGFESLSFHTSPNNNTTWTNSKMPRGELIVVHCLLGREAEPGAVSTFSQ
ncbi:hypothetical protein Tco_0252770 [Tanacetum coccineum]